MEPVQKTPLATGKALISQALCDLARASVSDRLGDCDA
jgi:hypothetical protein